MLGFFFGGGGRVEICGLLYFVGLKFETCYFLGGPKISLMEHPKFVQSAPQTVSAEPVLEPVQTRKLIAAETFCVDVIVS